MPVVQSAEFPSLFSHSKRTGWGIAVLSGERDGKRSYLFEDGEERMLGPAGIEQMRKVEHPDRDQQATCAHLLTLLAKRQNRREPQKALGASALERQLERFHKRYRGGFFGNEWRSEKGNTFARKARGALVGQVQARLSSEAVAKLVKEQGDAGLWREAVTLLTDSGMATGELRQTDMRSEQRMLSETLRELLHGQASYEHRFDRWIAAYSTTFRDSPSWQTATALPALMSPVDHVYVEAVSFRKQLRILAREGTLGARPSGAAYARCLAGAQALANMLAARGEVPLDLLDVHDFIRSTA